jgi:transposase-like protein
VRLVEGGQSIASVARTLGVVDQTLFNWVKAKCHRSPYRSQSVIGM